MISKIAWLSSGCAALSSPSGWSVHMVVSPIFPQEELSDRFDLQGPHSEPTSGVVAYVRGLTVESGFERLTKSVEYLTGWLPAEFTGDSEFWPAHIHPDDRERTLRLFARGTKQGRATLEYRFQRKQGTYLWLRDEIYVQSATKGAKDRVTGYWHDIPESVDLDSGEDGVRKGAIKRSYQLFQMAFHARAGLGSMVRLSDKTYVEVNSAMSETLGYRLDEMIGRTSVDIGLWVTLADRNKILEVICEAGRISDFETRWFTRNGSIIDVVIAAERIDRGDESVIVTVAENVTRRKIAEIALRQSEEMLRLVTDNLPAAISYVGNDLRYRFLNRPLENVLDAKNRSLVGTRFGSHARSENWDVMPAFAQRALNGETFSETLESKRADGETTHQRISFVPHFGPNGEVLGFVTLSEDIGDLIKTQDALRQHESILIEAQRIAHFGNWELNVRSGKRKWSQEFRRIYGIDAEEIPTLETVLRVVDSESRAGLREALEKIELDGEPYEMEYGEYKTYEDLGDAYTDTMEVMRGLVPTHVVFNGAAGALTGDNALTAKVGETVLILHAQANRDTRPHLIGGHGDYAWETGSFDNPPATNLETWFIRGGSAGAAIYTFKQPGLYSYVNHNLIEAILLGAVAHINVEGEWNDDLMFQVKPPSGIGTGQAALSESTDVSAQ